MTPDLALTTYDDSAPLELSRVDADFIGGQLKGRVVIRRELSDERFRLNAGPYVGVVRLPSGATLRCNPRIPTASVFQMLALAYSLPNLRISASVDLGELDQMLELVADYFAEQLEQRIEQGLYRAYVEVEENLPVIRGRIHVLEDARRNLVLRHRTFCRFAELTWDVPDNQVLRFVAHQLGGWPFTPALQARLQQLDRRMDEVTLVSFVSADLERFSYSRLNAGYEPLHRLCRLLLDNMSLSERQGDRPFDSFLLDMNDLFERFVGRAFQSWVHPQSGAVVLQRRAALGRRARADGTSGRWGVIRPDIEIHRQGRVRSVLDSKYKKTKSDAIKNPDFYQVLSYCATEATTLGGLIYPRSEFAEDDEIHIRNSSIRIRRFAVDLSVPQGELLQETRRLVDRVCEWIEDAEVSALSA